MNRVSFHLLKSRSPHGFNWLLLSVLLVLSALTPSRAQTVITNSDLSSITNGGYITFQTNGTFIVSNSITIRTNTQIDATGMNVVLSGNNSTRLFYISNKVTLTLINLQLTGGKSAQGAAIYNNLGTLFGSNIVFVGNNATNASGANGANGSGGHIAGNAGGNGVAGEGAAIFNNKGLLVLTNCTFTNNLAAGGNGGNGGDGFSGLGGDGGDGGDGGLGLGGAIYSTGTNYLIGCYFVGNGVFGGSGGAGGSGGSGPVSGDSGAGGQGNGGAGAAIYLLTGGVLRVTNTSFVANQVFGGPSAPQAITAGGVSSSGKNGGGAIGGAVENIGNFYAENCTFFTNSCLGGAGGNTLGDPNVSAGTGGTAIGGAVANAGTFLALNCTFATNNVTGGTNGFSPFSNRNGATGSALGGNLYRSAGTSKIINCLLQHGKGADNSGALADGGYNISSDTSCAFTSTNSIAKTNAMLIGALFTFPGVVPPLLEFKVGSVAQDRIRPIPSGAPTNFPATDERGQTRFDPLTNSLADVGAFEFAPTAPIIAIQPTNVFVSIGNNATFMVSATGASPLAYQWLFLGTNGILTPIHFGTNDVDATITITNVQTTNFGTYSVVITNGLGSVTSSNAVLALATAAAITSQSGPINTNFGSTVVFSVTATGAPLTYQWYDGDTVLIDVSNHVGTATASLTINSVTKADEGSYHVVVSSRVGLPQTSAPATLTVNDPAIVTQPTSQTANYQGPAVFTVVAISSTNSFFYTWHRGTNGAVIAGATRASYTNASATVSDQYFVVVSNVVGTITSDTVTLTVNNPGITVPPTNLVRDLGSSATFSVTAFGTPSPLAYQWSFNGVVKSNATATYNIPIVDATNAGTYTVLVSNGTNTATASATLTVQGSSSISGHILFGTNGVAGVSIGDGSTNVLSASDGSYLFPHLLSNSYVITPVQVGSGLTPASIPVVVDGVNPANGIDFSFNPPFLQIIAPPTNDVVPVGILSAPTQQSHLQSSIDLTNWTNAVTFITDTNGTGNVTVTNTTGMPEFFLRLTSP
jgi:hypothetical protein